MLHEEQEMMITPDRLTRHAETRTKMRCIKTEFLDYVADYGRCQSRRSRRDPRGSWRSSVESYSFTRKT
jgi:hypothetical protein